MKSSSIITVLAFALFTAFIGYAAVSSLAKASHSNTKLGDAFVPVNTATNTSVDCGSSSTQVIATSTGRTYLAIVNDSASTVYLGLGVPAVGSVGIRLNSSGGTFESIADQNLFTGAVFCTASSTARLTIVQY